MAHAPSRFPNERSNPRSVKTGGHDDQALAKAMDTPPTEEAVPSIHIVRQDSTSAPQRAPRQRRLPLANASLYEPAAGRTWWWISLRCPHCGSVHLGRVREEEQAGGPRRTGCGRKVWVKVRRTYRGYSGQVAA